MAQDTLALRISLSWKPERSGYTSKPPEPRPARMIPAVAILDWATHKRSSFGESSTCGRTLLAGQPARGGFRIIVFTEPPRKRAARGRSDPRFRDDHNRATGIKLATCVDAP